MTLPAAPPISLAQVRAEFGAPAGTPLHAFNRGGAWVPNIAQNSGVPANGAIRLAQLCGATAYTAISLSGPSTVGLGNIAAHTPPTTVVRTSGVALVGGQAPISYSWVRTSSASGVITASNTTSLNASWTAQGNVGGTGGTYTPYSETWRLTVSDGRTSATFDVTVTVGIQEV